MVREKLRLVFAEYSGLTGLLEDATIQGERDLDLVRVKHKLGEVLGGFTKAGVDFSHHATLLQPSKTLRPAARARLTGDVGCFAYPASFGLALAGHLRNLASGVATLEELADVRLGRRKLYAGYGLTGAMLT
jgi:hypothetical protein